MSHARNSRSYAATREETGYRSKLEAQVAEQLEVLGMKLGRDYSYESLVLPYTRPSAYRPDFILHRQAIIVEAKGLFESDDRTKMLLVKQQHPDLDIRLVFQNPEARLFKKSATTYAKWAEKHGFPYFKGLIPVQWLDHVPAKSTKEALEKFLKQSHG